MICSCLGMDFFTSKEGKKETVIAERIRDSENSPGGPTKLNQSRAGFPIAEPTLWRWVSDWVRQETTQGILLKILSMFSAQKRLCRLMRKVEIALREFWLDLQSSLGKLAVVAACSQEYKSRRSPPIVPYTSLHKPTVDP